MMAKAIATGFNSPFVTMPGSGFAQTFIGIDAIIVRVLAMRAKKQARKWGGQCIVFIDEIDAVGMRRQSLGPASSMTNIMGYAPAPDGETWETPFYGPHGALNASGDLIIENEEWRQWRFSHRAGDPKLPYPGWYRKIVGIVNQGAFPGMMGGMGGLALNQLLVTMDGVDNPPFWRKFWSNRANSFFDAIYIVPRRVRKRWAFVIAVGLDAIGAFLFLNCFLDAVADAPLYAPLTASATAWNIIVMATAALIIVIGSGIWSAATGKKKRREEAKKWVNKPNKGRSDNDDYISLRLPRSKPTGNQIYFIGATNVPLEMLDPALTRPGRMGRHVWFRTPTKEDRKDIFDLYLGKVAHDPNLDTPERRDEIARITNGYSPAEINQICSMALTSAHHEGRPYFVWEDLVEAMTINESGSAVNVTYPDDDSRSIAIHEAGHAAAAHVYRPDLESSRLSIRMRGGSLGHHQSFEKEEHFTRRQSSILGSLIHTVGAMAAEFVFYGENSTGVGGDLGMVSWRAASAVGGAGMSPLPIDLKGRTFADETEAQSNERVVSRLEDIGSRLLNTGAIQEPRKRAYACQMIGQAFVTAYVFIKTNREKVESVADAVYDQKEIYGDDLVRLLDAQNFEAPDIDWTAEDTWPKIMYYTKLRRDEEKERVQLEKEGNNGHDEFEGMM
jgi:SpoVK/Ycf46/Vps4 family AAA+-type ATPase